MVWSVIVWFQIARIVSFAEDDDSAYIAMDPVNVGEDFQATMKIKSQQDDGLIFYVSDDAQVFILSCSSCIHVMKKKPVQNKALSQAHPTPK